MLERPLQVVAGKGGVGRSTIATALALRSAGGGDRTLLLELDSEDSAATMLGVPSAVDEPREVLNRLWLCRMTSEGSLREYALMVLKFRALYGLVFENKLVKYLLRSIPSLAEFTMLGKTWYHATEKRPDGMPRFTRIIVDAPATGHAISFLSVARAVADLSPPGPMKRAAERMAELVESRGGSCLHVVSLPEEMPVNEGLELVAAARGKLHMATGLAVVNRMLAPLLAEEGEQDVLVRLEARSQEESALSPYVTAARRRLDREQSQAEQAMRFIAQARLPFVVVPEVARTRRLSSVLEEVARCFDRSLEPDRSASPSSELSRVGDG